jgi:hypothetical protein
MRPPAMRILPLPCIGPEKDGRFYRGALRVPRSKQWIDQFSGNDLASARSRAGKGRGKGRTKSLLGGAAALGFSLAFGTEFLAFLAMKSLGIGLLGALQ